MAQQPRIKKKLGKREVKTPDTSLVQLSGTTYDSLIPEGEDKLKILEAMSVYLSTGNLVKVEQLTGVSAKEMSTKMSTPWWNTTLAELRVRQQDALDGRISGLIDVSLDVVADRLANGDPQWVKDGVTTEILDDDGKVIDVVTVSGIVSVPVKAGVAAKIMGTLYEKRALIRGDSTSNARKEESGLDKLAKLLESISKEKKVERVIPGERLE